MIRIAYLYSIKQGSVWYLRFRENVNEIKEDLKTFGNSVGELHQVILENKEFRFVPVRDVKLFLKK